MGRALWWFGLGVAAVAIGACGRPAPTLGKAPSGSATVIASNAYASKVGPTRQRDTLAALRQVVEGLRENTHSGGWQARQDDLTGDAAELSGGVFRSDAGRSPLDATRDFVVRYGAAFGLVGVDQLVFPDVLAVDDMDGAVFRSQQFFRGIPVDGTSLIVALDRAGSAPQISFVRGRVFRDLATPTNPAVGADAARRVAEQLTGAPVTEPFSLVIYTKTAAPVLAWTADVTSSTADTTATMSGAGAAQHLLTGPSQLFVDAEQGSILEVRPTSVGLVGEATTLMLGLAAGITPQTAPPQVSGSGPLGNGTFAVPAGGTAATVSGQVIGGREVSVPAERLPDGSVALVDATQPGADQPSRSNLITVHEGAGIAITARKQQPDLSDLPGPVITFPAGQTPDTESLTAAWAARQVLDYYRTEHGRDSFDGAKAALPSTVHIPQPQGECATNGAFLAVSGHSQMIYGQPCTASNGLPLVRTWVDVGIVAHEVTHGVTHTNARDIGQSIQSGAVDEGTSDYFGVVVQDRVTGQPWTTVGVLACQDVAASPVCLAQRDGNMGVRNVDSGSTFDDYEFVIEEPLGIAGKTVDALHENSLIYTNALWKIRTRFAALDGGDPVTSQEAKKFDRVVYRATIRYFGDTTDFLAAAEAIQRAAGEVAGVTPDERRFIHDQFAYSKLCRGCNSPPQTPRPAAVSSTVKVRPQVADRGIVYTEYTGQLSSHPALADLGADLNLSLPQSAPLTLFTVAAGHREADLALDIAANSTTLTVHDLGGGSATILSTDPYPLVKPALSGDFVAWVDVVNANSLVLKWQTIGAPAARSLPIDQLPSHVAVDGSRVAYQLEDGTVAVWDAVSGNITRLPTVPAFQRVAGVQLPPGGIAISNNRVAVLGFANSIDNFRLMVFDLDGHGTLISDHASPFGLTLHGDLLIWAENVGAQGGQVVLATGSKVEDTDIEAYSFATDTFYRIFPERGQQGYPSYDGHRLAWQDASLGGNDIFTVVLPQGL